MDKDAYVIAEHLRGELADVTFEMLGKARELVDATGGRLRAVLIGKDVKDLAGRLGLAD